MMSSDSVFPEFPHDVNDQPTDDWTVEDLMKWCLLQRHQKLDRIRDDRIAALNREAQAGKDEIWKLHEQAVQSKEASIMQDVTMEENGDPKTNRGGAQAKHHTTTKAGRAARKDRAGKNTELTAPSILVTITDGKQVGKTFELYPTKHVCLLGRSSGKKFKTGVSLPKDPEVSTTHGKFECLNGKMYYSDVGSTNGTVHEEVELEDNVPLELTDGMVLRVGGTIVTINLRNLES